MKTIVKNTAATLGYELIELFIDMCGEDLSLLEELVDEAICTLKIARKDENWSDITLLDYEEFEEIIYQF